MSVPTNNVIPERILLGIVRDGIAAISADLLTTAAGETILDNVLDVLDATERAKARALWETNPPSAIMGFARTDSPFPCFALTLASDDIQQDYVGLSEQMLLSDPDEIKLGSVFRRRLRGVFTWWCYAEQPDVLAWWYRVLRRVLNAAIPRMLAAGLQDPTLQGADLVPDPQYTPDNVFTRRLTITVEYEEDWTADALWQALNGPAEPFIVDPDQVSVHHVDQRKIPGGVTPPDE